MADLPKLEVWLRGPLTDTPLLLQPIAHALLQAQEEVHEMMANFPLSLLWKRPADIASVAFHLQHLRGVLERLFTYARGESLTAEQLTSLALEGKENADITIEVLLSAFDQQIVYALHQLQGTAESTLTEFRTVGRGKLPSTVIGLLVHSAEHTTRHVGQLLVTIKILKTGYSA